MMHWKKIYRKSSNSTPGVLLNFWPPGGGTIRGGGLITKFYRGNIFWQTKLKSKVDFKCIEFFY